MRPIAPRLALIVAVLVRTAVGQDIRIFSEFERFDPFGHILPVDRAIEPREILSPAMTRNGHLSVHLIVTGASGTNYFIYIAANPPGILELTLYREHFVRCGEEYCPDWLTQIDSPSFGAIPESVRELPGQTARAYLLDIHAPADAVPRRVRVEALLKIGTWIVAPMEVRIVAPVIPSFGFERMENIAPLDAPSSATAHIQLLRFITGQPPQLPPGILRIGDVIQRNAAEDMLLAKYSKAAYPALGVLSWLPFTYPPIGSEWYLRVRDFLYRQFAQ